MGRGISFEWTTDTSTFSATQVQPRLVAGLTWNALARWLRQHLVPFPTLIRRERTGLVAMGFHLEYLSDVPLFDCEALRVQAALRSMRGGERARLDVRFLCVPEQPMAAAQLILCPVRIDEPRSLAAIPARFNERVMGLFRSDECDAVSPERLVPERRALLETGSAVLAHGTHPFFIHRHLTEFAEQWAWPEVPSIVEGARETLALSGNVPPELLGCLRHPLKRFDVEFSRPFFSFEAGEVVSRAFKLPGDGLGFVHQLTSDKVALHATATEVF